MQNASYIDSGFDKSSDAAMSDICCFVRNPFPGCHCKNLTSTNIPKVISVCVNNFRFCAIYLSELEK